MFSSKKSKECGFFFHIEEIQNTTKEIHFSFTFCGFEKKQFALIIFKMIEVRHLPLQTYAQLSG